MNQQQLNAIRTLAQKAINAHREAKKKKGSSLTDSELKSLLAPFREKVALYGCGDIEFTFYMGVVNGSLMDR